MVTRQLLSSSKQDPPLTSSEHERLVEQLSDPLFIGFDTDHTILGE